MQDVDFTAAVFGQNFVPFYFLTLLGRVGRRDRMMLDSMIFDEDHGKSAEHNTLNADTKIANNSEIWK